jgi:hypothetical protein
VCAGAMEPFDIYVWSLQTGKVLDVLSGHEGPVCGLALAPNQVKPDLGYYDSSVVDIVIVCPSPRWLHPQL